MSNGRKASSRCAWRVLLSAGLALGAGSGSAWGQIDPNPAMLRYPDVSSTHVAFVYANDLWLVPREGGVAKPLVSPPGMETFPRFSPDGKHLAFVGNYEGDRDLYTIPVDGGVATRVTHHPGNEVLSDWTADNRLLFFTSGLGGLARQNQIMTVSPQGGLPEQLPMPYGTFGAISADGRTLAYTPHTHDGRTWKRYRGGMATDLWLFDLTDATARRVTDWEGTDTQPMWHGGKLYYVSDAGPEHRQNIWMLDPATGVSSQVTRLTDDDVRWPAMGPGRDGGGEIVFQAGSGIMLLDLPTGQLSRVDVTIPGDRPTIRPQQVDASRNMVGATISPEGKRVAIEARGEIFSVPVEKGVTRNLTRTDGTAERYPSWSPDGRWIAYFSDESGEYQLFIRQSDGRGETRQITSDGAVWRYNPVWSPDSEHIVFTDKTGAAYLVTLETGEVKHLDTDPWAQQIPVSFSHDSRWIAYSRSDEANNHDCVWIYNVETGERTRATDPMFNTSRPVFDRKGEFLYALSNRSFESPLYGELDTSFVYGNTQVVLAFPLRDDVKSPYLPESDEVEWKDEADDKNGDDEKDEDGGDDEGDEGEAAATGGLAGSWSGRAIGGQTLPEGGVGFTMDLTVKGGTVTGTVTSDMGGGTVMEGEFDDATGKFRLVVDMNGMPLTLTGLVSGDSVSGEWEYMEERGTWSGSREGGQPAAAEDDDENGEGEGDDEKKEEEKKPESFEIDFDGFEARGMRLPFDRGVFGSLGVTHDGKVVVGRGTMRGESGTAVIQILDPTDRKREVKEVAKGSASFDLSADGKKILTMSGGSVRVLDARAGGEAKMVPTGDLQMTVNPRNEWQQIFTDAWRVQRDFFYEEGLHGVDWEHMRRHYGAMLADAATREDVSWIIRELISELNVGHAYYWGGDEEREPSRSVGLLGADFELASTEEGTAYRIRKIHRGAAWDVDARGPLGQPGVEVKEGDFILAVNGVPIDTSKDPWAAFLNTAGKVTALTVSDRPVLDDTALEVLVEPVGDDQNLRYRAWIEANRAYVDYKSGGRIGYIYVPNTGVDGQDDLVRQFYGQRMKDALIIDERWNGGGQIPTRFIELLNRPRTNYWARRDGKDWPWPPDSHQGPKAMLINGLAGSGGDMFPALFRQTGLGKLIGTRTWGGLVGISGNPGLIDGGYTSAPTFGYYEVDGTWGIEGHGVDPDIEVIDDPALLARGEDPQLDAAIEHLLGELRVRGYEPAKRPAGPNRAGMGLPPEDR